MTRIETQTAEPKPLTHLSDDCPVRSEGDLYCDDSEHTTCQVCIHVLKDHDRGVKRRYRFHIPTKLLHSVAAFA